MKPDGPSVCVLDREISRQAVRDGQPSYCKLESLDRPGMALASGAWRIHVIPCVMGDGGIRPVLVLS